MRAVAKNTIDRIYFTVVGVGCTPLGISVLGAGCFAAGLFSQHRKDKQREKVQDTLASPYAPSTTTARNSMG